MAMPEEIRPLLACVGRVCKGQRGGSTIYSFNIGGYQVSALLSGMGTRNGTTAAQILVAQCSPQLLINAGFAGSITGEAAVGDIVLADRVFHYDNGHLHERERLDPTLPRQVADIFSNMQKCYRVLQGAFITTTGITRKSELAASLTPSSKVAVVDMETAAVARVASETGTPFVAIRAISDGATEELGFSIEEISDSACRVSIPKVLGTVVRKPWIVPQIVRLARNSRHAGGNLADALQHLLVRL